MAKKNKTNQRKGHESRVETRLIASLPGIPNAVKLELNLPASKLGLTDIRLNWISGIAFMTGMPVLFTEIDLVKMS